MGSLHLSSSVLLAIGISLGGITAAAIIFLFVPNDIADPALRGYRLTKRKEALESPTVKLFWPFVKLCTYYAQLIPLTDWKEQKGLQLRHAGEPWGLSADEFLGLNIAGFLAGGFSTFAVATLLDMGYGLVVIGVVLGIFLPNLWLAESAEKRLSSINRGLPQALDLIVLSMSAGLDFVGAVRHVVEKWTDKRDPLCEELQRFMQELNLGKTRREALEDLAYRAPTELVKAFVSNAVQAEKRGTPLVEVLQIQAEVARTKRFQMAEKVAGRAGVVILMPLMFIFASTVLIMFGSLVVKQYRGQLF